jgi:GNAT superfamily N-acetyltransferase
MDYSCTGPFQGQATACMPILRELPDWFGLEAALLEYEKQIDTLPTFLASANSHIVGFLSLKQHYPHSAEIYVMGVRLEAQRGGIGRALVEAAESYARSLGVEYLQVKTLGTSNPDPGYAKTRTFYEAMGFCPLEEFRQIWDENNPCLILVKRL